MSSGPHQSMQEILDHVASGRLDEAEALCRQALHDVPDDVNVLAMLGAILLKHGQFAESESLLKQAILN